MTVDRQMYWSIEECGWRRSPTADPLATPWSDSMVGLPWVLPPADAADVLRMRRADLPQQRDIEQAPVEPAPAEPTPVDAVTPMPRADGDRVAGPAQQP